MFLHLSVSHSVHKGAGVCAIPACIVGGILACLAAGLQGGGPGPGGGGWSREGLLWGVCSQGVCSWGGAWWRPPWTATAAGGTHATGMHSCCSKYCCGVYAQNSIVSVDDYTPKVAIIASNGFDFSL